jgi:hypothetical protein
LVGRTDLSHASFLYKIPGIRHSKSSFVLRVLEEATVPLAELLPFPAPSRHLSYNVTDTPEKGTP